MEYIPSTADYSPVAIWTAIALVFFVVWAILGHRYSADGPRKEPRGFFALSTGVLLAGCLSLTVAIAAFLFMGAQIALREEAIHGEIAETYGIYISSKDGRELRYPDSKPSDGFKEFGSFDRDNGERATLVWTGDEFQLGELEDEFREFPRR